MTLTFNGKVLAGFVAGVLVGVGITALSARHVYADQAQTKEAAIRLAFYEDFGLHGPIQATADKMDLWTLFSEVGKEYQVRANLLQQLSARQQGPGIPAAGTAQSADDQGFAMLNKIYPGWGTASKIAKTVLDQHQTQQPAPPEQVAANSCRTGMQWNGFKCVCSPPTVPVTMNDGSVACFSGEVVK